MIKSKFWSAIDYIKLHVIKEPNNVINYSWIMLTITHLVSDGFWIANLFYVSLPQLMHLFQ